MGKGDRILKRHKSSAPFFADGMGLTASPGWEDIFLSACLSPSQTKDALLKILEDVKEDDYLNFILFSGGVTTWKDTLVQATPENIQEARKFVMNIRDQGSKNRGEGATSCHSCLPEQPISLLPWGRDSAGPGPADPGWG